MSGVAPAGRPAERPHENGGEAPTRILALVRNDTERRLAEAAGAEARLLEGASPAAAEHWCEPAEMPDPASLRAAGVETLVLDASPGRLLDRLSFAELAERAAACRSAGLAIGLAGALEAPDVPRLLPLAPRLLVFREALRDGDGAFDPAALRALVALCRPSAPAAPHGPPDRVFIRDLVLDMEIGAYASERGRRQRVRFSVEAELAPVAGPRSLADIYSYDRMMDAVRALAHRAPEPFVETLAETLAAEILLDRRVRAASVRVEKLDLGPAAAGVEIRRERPGARADP